MTNNIQGIPIRLSADLTETLQAIGNGMMKYLKCWKGRVNSQEYSTQQDSHSDLMDKSKAF